VTSRAALLPDTITSIGLLAGCVSLVSAVSGQLSRAALMIGVSIACDITDGFVARSTHSASQFGLEYDSLSDVVAFGAAPATLAYAWALAPLHVWAVLAVGAFIICSALRLARFNIQTGSSGGKKRFVGLPVPGAAAMIAGGFIGYSYFRFDSPYALSAVVTALMLTLAALMVSRVPYPSIKEIDLASLKSPSAIASILLAIGLLVVLPELSALLAATGYLLSGPLLLAFGEHIKRERSCV
jgi:CDP-diacylglycerol---serine O-phosphatidyltransferase